MMAVAIACAMTGESSFAQIPCSYEVAAIIQAPASPGFSSPTRALAISPNGRYVVGFFTPNAFGFDRGYWFDTLTGEFNILPFPGSGYQSSYCNDVNDDGLIVGSLWYTIGTETQRGFVFNLNTQQFITQLMPLPGGAWCSATGINQAGTVCGTRSIGSKTDPVNPQTAFIWTQKDGFNDLGLINDESTSCVDINDVGIALGSMMRISTTMSFTWNGVSLAPVPPVNGVFGTGVEIKSDGSVIGVVVLATGPLIARAFTVIHGDGVMYPPLPGLTNSSAADMTNDGIVLGWSVTGGGGPMVATIWVDGQPIRLQDLVIGESPSLRSCQATSDSGVLVVNTNSLNAAVLRPVQALGDINGDCVVGVADLIGVIMEWRKTDSPADLNGDGIVGVADLLTVIAHWTG